MIKKILVVSDVHNNLDTLKKIIKLEKDVDLKVFSGDLQNKNYDLIKNNFDYFVLGNSDYYFEELKNFVFFEFEGIKFLLTHGHLFGSFFKKIDFDKMYLFAKNKNVNFVIHGHDHKKRNEKIEDIIFFNPGSTNYPRDGMIGSYGIIELENKNVKNIKHILLDLL